MVLAIVCIIGLFQTAKVEASTVTVNGGYTTRANAYSWGTYSTINTITVVLPETEEIFGLNLYFRKKSVCMQDVLTVQKMKVCTLEWEYDIANTGYKSY